MTEAERIEKEATDHAKNWKGFALVYDAAKDGYIAGATAEHERLQEQLTKERELRKDMVEKLIAVIDEYATMDIVKIKHDYPYYEDEYKYIRSIVKEAKEL